MIVSWTWAVTSHTLTRWWILWISKSCWQPLRWFSSETPVSAQSRKLKPQRRYSSRPNGTSWLQVCTISKVAESCTLATRSALHASLVRQTAKLVATPSLSAQIPQPLKFTKSRTSMPAKWFVLQVTLTTWHPKCVFLVRFTASTWQSTASFCQTERHWTVHR